MSLDTDATKSMVMAHPGVAARFCDEERSAHEMMEDRLQSRVMVKGELSFHMEQFEITPM